MGKKNNKKSNQNEKYPLVSICTPTFNRRPFIPMMLKCFENQTYPKDRIEWIIIDDGTDKIGDLVSHISQIQYFSYNEKMTLGKKRNLAHDKCTGSIVIYMDDDDYYPPERISHAVETLQKNPHALCAGSSIMHIYFKHIGQMIQFGPYGPNHATAATFAFRRELLLQSRYEETACVAEEKYFLKNYSVPFVQLDTMKTILVFSHVHNSFDKKKLLQQGENDYVKRTNIKVEDFVKEPEILQFFMKDIDMLLEKYEPGKPENKSDVLKQMEEMQVKREKMIEEHQKNQQNIMMNEQIMKMQQQINQLGVINQELTMENTLLKNKNSYLEEKISKLIQDLIELKKNQKQN
jgi:glycosyltransferase involved in cell wall biosynthesis